MIELIWDIVLIGGLLYTLGIVLLGIISDRD
jgi:hypothetical protein